MKGHRLYSPSISAYSHRVWSAKGEWLVGGHSVMGGLGFECRQTEEQALTSAGPKNVCLTEDRQE